MSDFDFSGSMQAATAQIEAMAQAAAAAAGASATIQHELVTVVVSAAPRLESVTYPWSSLRGVDAEAMAQATRTAIADALVAIQQRQAEQLQGTPLASIIAASEGALEHFASETVDRARTAAADLASQEHTATDADGRVEVTVDGVGAITRLWFSATASRESAAEWLPESVRSTINEALDRARRAQLGALGGESSDLEAQLDEVLEASEARMAGLFSRLDAVERRLGDL